MPENSKEHVENEDKKEGNVSRKKFEKPSEKPVSDLPSGEEYSGDNIEVLEGLEPVRMRPGMYIGTTGPKGLHHLVWEIIDNSVDEHVAGYADRVDITIHADNSVSVEDNGRGIPVDIKEEYGKSAAEIVMTVLHAGGKFDGGGYKTSGGLHGVGISVVNALSEDVELTIYKNGEMHKQKYHRGVPTTELVPYDMPEGMDKQYTGTRVWFKPDYEIFEELEYSWETIKNRMRESAFLNAGLEINLSDKRENGKNLQYKFEGGIRDFVIHLAHSAVPIHPVLYFQQDNLENDSIVEVAFQWNQGYKRDIHSYANNINTHEGGSHEDGFIQAILKVVFAYAKSGGLIKDKDEKWKKEDVQQGLAAVVSVKLVNPEFEGQTKNKLGTPTMRKITSAMVADRFGQYMEENPNEAHSICQRVMAAALERANIAKTRENLRKNPTISTGGMPHKLTECLILDPMRSELFLVEGDSAGGSAIDGRNDYQAVLPLRGKILNVEKAQEARIFANNEIKDIIQVLGAGVGEDIDLSKLRYHKLIILTDADVDGSHIRTLLLTFLFRQLPELIDAGHVYIGQPPLYMVGKGKKSYYVQDDAELIQKTVSGAMEEITLYSGAGKVQELNNKIFAQLGSQTRRIRGIMNALEITYGKGSSTILSHWALNGGSDNFDDMIKWGSENEEWPRLLTNGTSIRLRESASSPQLPLRINADIMEDANWGYLKESIEKIQNLVGAGPYKITRGAHEEVVTADKLHAAVVHIAQKNVSIQRFKGLGEMNWDQLRDTTLDPLKRTLLQVTVDQAEEANEVFSMLMGDDVEPRREFIEQNALKANVDL